MDDRIIRQIYAQARLLGCCDKFKGTEDVGELIALFLSPQGLEFCMKNHFPNIAAVRQFKGERLERYGIYLDAGAITLDNPKTAVLIGRTSATVNCDRNDALHRVTLLHGARAVVNATRWAVVSISAEQGCAFIKSTSDNAIIL